MYSEQLLSLHIVWKFLIAILFSFSDTKILQYYFNLGLQVSTFKLPVQKKNQLQANGTDVLKVFSKSIGFFIVALAGYTYTYMQGLF